LFENILNPSTQYFESRSHLPLGLILISKIRQEFFVKMTIWKIPCQFPRCGKQFLFSDIGDKMIINVDVTFLDALLRRGRFRRLPDTTY
jgi:hypothetical protein